MSGSPHNLADGRHPKGDTIRKVGGRGMVDILFYAVAGIAIVGALIKIIKNKKDDK